jgi:hypothetical protein
MACKDPIESSEALSHTFAQVSLGSLPTSNSAALSAAECGEHSGKITGNVRRDI